MKIPINKTHYEAPGFIVVKDVVSIDAVRRFIREECHHEGYNPTDDLVIKVVDVEDWLEEQREGGEKSCQE